MKTKEEKQHETLPTWVKTVAAIIGIAATAATIITGISAVILQYRSVVAELERERTSQQVAIKGAEEARIKQIEANMEASRLERQGRAAEQALTLELRREEARQVEAQLRQQQKSESAREREENLRQERDFLLAVSKVADSDTPSLGDLITIKAYSRSHLEHAELVATALVARAEASLSIAEIRFIFDVLADLGPRSRRAVEELRGIALKRYRTLLEGVLLVHLIRYEDSIVSRESVCTTVDLLPRRILSSELGADTQQAVAANSFLWTDEGLAELDTRVEEAQASFFFDEERAEEGEAAYLDQLDLNGAILAQARRVRPNPSAEVIELDREYADFLTYCRSAAPDPAGEAPGTGAPVTDGESSFVPGR